MWGELNVVGSEYGRNECGVEGNECGVEKSGEGGKRVWGEKNVG